METARIQYYLIVAAFALITFCCSNPAQDSAEKLKERLNTICKETGTPGAILAVDFGSNKYKAVATGYADRETHKPMTPESPYYQGSITKTYTAVTILRLAQEGRLSLEDTVEKFIPSFPDGNKITVRQLLQHTSGLKDFYSYLYYRPNRDEMIKLVTKRWSQPELIELSSRFGRWFDPGTDWTYSSTNYFLLGVIIEHASGLQLPEAYRHYIYDPLKITRTWLPHHEKDRGILPTGYMGKVKEWKHSEMFGELSATTVLDQSTVELSAGGLAAPADDALKFINGVFKGKLLSPSSLEMMKQFRSIPQLGITDSHQDSHKNSDGYGLGLIRMELEGYTLLGHGGLYNGHTAGLWYIPDRDITLALYLNRGFVDQRAILKQLLTVISEIAVQ